jgi:hypothetical protein
MRRIVLHAGAGAGAAALLGGLAWAAASWRRDQAGTERWLPGDELVPGPADTTTRALDIDAPPEAVWAWLVQIGTDRGGWYSHDRLERLVGVPVHSTDEVRAEWQHLAVGDRVCLAPPGWMGIEGGMRLPVVDLVPGRRIVLRQSPPDSPWDGVWSFHVRSRGTGSRLLVHSRTARPEGLARTASLVLAPVGRLVTGVMERGMMRGIKRRAERTAVAVASPAVGAPAAV